jgi:hypothetical protein
MRSTHSSTNDVAMEISGVLLPSAPHRGGALSPWGPAVLIASLLLCAGCARLHNYWIEDGPASTLSSDSPTAADLRATRTPAPQRQREWRGMPVAAADGTVTHGPLYFEDPFEDKGHGRDTFQIGWEDYLAMPYGLARYLLNGVALPVSLVVTWPWTAMESDGLLSRQLLGYDHDAIAAHLAGREREQRSPTPQASGSPALPQASPPAPPGTPQPSTEPPPGNAQE